MKVHQIIQKTSILFLFSIFILFFFTSCEKCMHCRYTYTYMSKEEKHDATECGNNEDIDEFKAAIDYAASQFDTIAVCVPN